MRTGGRETNCRVSERSGYSSRTEESKVYRIYHTGQSLDEDCPVYLFDTTDLHRKAEGGKFAWNQGVVCKYSAKNRMQEVICLRAAGKG